MLALSANWETETETGGSDALTKSTKHSNNILNFKLTALQFRLSFYASVIVTSCLAN